ncbi:MAG: Rho termination factor N-terminal domain-containing protein, partial [Solirubrobacterales bacterium]
TEPPARPDPTRATGASASPAAGSSRTKASGSSSSNGEPTKAELYERAQELGIEGRSKMSKRELQRAIEAAGS